MSPRYMPPIFGGSPVIDLAGEPLFRGSAENRSSDREAAHERLRRASQDRAKLLIRHVLAKDDDTLNMWVMP